MPFFVLLFSILLMSPPVYAHKHADGEAGSGVELMKISETLSVVQAGGGNIAVFHGADGTFMVDNGLADKREIVKNALQNVTTAPINYLVNTHWHFDHAGNNEVFGKKDTTILAHENARARLKSGGEVKAFNAKIPPYPKTALPVITYQDKIKLHLNDQNIEVYAVGPAHTDGDSFIVFKEQNIIHTGDLFFNGFWPFIDASSGGAITGVIAAVDQILTKSNEQTKIIPGHGPVASKQDLQSYRDVLQAVFERLQKADNKDQWIKSKPLIDLDEKWGQGFLSTEKFTSIVWDTYK